MRRRLVLLVLAGCAPNAQAVECRPEGVIRYEPRTFLGYECPDDCGQHKAGYAWAERAGLTGVAGCAALVGPRREGCTARIELASTSEAVGYRWALENEVVRPCECDGAGPGFRSGCLQQLLRSDQSAAATAPPSACSVWASPGLMRQQPSRAAAGACAGSLLNGRFLQGSVCHDRRSTIPTPRDRSPRRHAMKRLEGKVCIITGGTSGIGRRTAEVFAAEGAHVVIAGRREAEGLMVAHSIGAACQYVRTDVTDEAQIAALVEYTMRHHGRVDCLFNNAGGPAPPGGIETIPADGFDAAIATLLRSVLLGMKHVAPIMTRQRSGSIVNNGSVAGHRAGLSSSFVYSAAKAAVIHLTRCVAMQLGEHGVRVNSISPGGIATGMFGKVVGLKGEQAERTADIVKGVLASAQPIPRAGLPDDIAQAAVFLASDDSTFVNGHDLVVDGGLIGGARWSEQQSRLQAMRTAFLAQVVPPDPNG